MNVLLDDFYNAKIADFGESIIERSNRTASRTHQQIETGTAGWAAPETILGKGATKASDVFSFGIVLWELLTWRVPSVMISVETLLEEKVRRHTSVNDHPLLSIVREQRNMKVKKGKEREMSPAGAFRSVFSGELLLKPPGGVKNPIHGGYVSGASLSPASLRSLASLSVRSILLRSQGQHQLLEQDLAPEVSRSPILARPRRARRTTPTLLGNCPFPLPSQ
jgi:serine/threonine protein kinase